MLQAEISQKPCTFWEIDIFTCFWAVLYWGSMEGVWLENANLLVAISISGRLFARRGNFLTKCKGLTTYEALFGQLVSRRVRQIIGSVWCTQIFQVSNWTIGCTSILDRSARLYGDRMEPDHTVKYKISYKKPTFYDNVLTPFQFWGCFWTRLGILRSPMWFLSGKLEYWRNSMRNSRGGKFCSILTWATSTRVRPRTVRLCSTHLGTPWVRRTRGYRVLQLWNCY
jgi:hypothetical protein